MYAAKQFILSYFFLLGSVEWVQYSELSAYSELQAKP